MRHRSWRDPAAKERAGGGRGPRAAVWVVAAALAMSGLGLEAPAYGTAGPRSAPRLGEVSAHGAEVRAAPLRPRARRAGEGTLLMNETFKGGSAADPNLIPLNTACLTGAAAGSTPPADASRLGPCASSVDAPATGVTPGYLQLTDNRNNTYGGVVYNKSLPGNGGLVAEFESYQYNGTKADGISFFLTDGSSQLTTAGGYGGALGYAALKGYADGVHNGYVGVGFDIYGSYNIATGVTGGGCPERPNTQEVPNAVGIRGPGDGSTGYCYLAGTIPAFGRSSTLTSPLRGTDLADAIRKTRVTVSPDTLPTITVEIDFNDGTGYRTVLSHTMTTPVPPTYKFGFAASTGNSTDVHLIRNIAISTVTPLARINLVKQVDKTDPQPATYKVGDEVPYQFVVTNSGSEPVSAVAVTDPAIPGVTCPTTTLAPAGNPGSTMICTGRKVLIAADVSPDGTFTNTARATGQDQTGKPVEPSESTVTVPVTKPPTPGPISVVKKDAQTGEVLPGAVFQLWRETNGTDGLQAVGDTPDTTVGDPCTTDAKGICASTVKPGSYYWQETKAPADYQLPQQRVYGPLVLTNASSAKGVVITAKNTPIPPTSRITLVKKDAKTGRLLPGAVFQLWRENGKQSGLQASGTRRDTLVDLGCATGGTGRCSFNKLPIGAYYLRETAVPEGYVMPMNPVSGPHRITDANASRGITVTLNNHPGESDKKK